MINDQEISIATCLESGFKRIVEADSPIIFNLANPVYLKKGNNYIVIDAQGCCIDWDHGNLVSRNRLLETREDAILNPGDLLEDEEY